MRELYPALLLWASTRVEMSVGSRSIRRMAGVCILLRLTVAGISYVDIEKISKKRRSANFQEDTLPGVRLSCRPRGYDLLRCPCRCLSLLIHYVDFSTVTMWAGFLRAFCLNSPLRYQGLGTLVVTVPCDFGTRQTTAALLSYHAAVLAPQRSPRCFTAYQIAYTLHLAPQL